MASTSASAAPPSPALSLPGASAGTRTTADRVRRLLLTTYFAATFLFVASVGMTFDREVIVLWIMGALAVGCVGKGAREAGVLLVSWLPFLGAVVFYEVARGIADNLGRPVTYTPQIDAEKALFLGHVPSVWLQEHLYDPDRVHVQDVLASLVYVSHFIVPYAVAAWLWKRDRRTWRWYAATYFLLSLAGCITFALAPTAPPWMAAEQHLLPGLSRIALRGWDTLGLGHVALLIGAGQASVNQVAAVPSLHGAHAALVACFLWRYVPRRIRPLLAAYPVAMAFTLAYSGEHYVVDVLVGWTFLAALLAAGALVRKRTGWASPFPARS